MDTNEDSLPTGDGENSGYDRNKTYGTDGRTASTKPEDSKEADGFERQLNLLRGVLKGDHKWNAYLSHKNFVDVRGALRIVYSYHPKNRGTDPDLPKAGLGDIEQMREDLLHLSALNCYLAAQAAMYETNADNIEQEIKLAKSVGWRKFRKDINSGKITEKLTQDDLKHLVEADAVDLYRLLYELRQVGRMYSWVRAAVRTFTEHLAVLIQSSMREERGDAKLH